VRYLALVTDYDGVIAGHDRPSPAAMAAIGRLRASGRRAIMITGRRLNNLLESCPDLSLFDYVVAENGAVVYEPRTREETLLGKPPPAEFVERLRQLGVDRLEIGRVIVATWAPHQNVVLQAIQELGLELHITFNRAAVMVLPAGVNKASGMVYVLRKLGLSPHEAVGVGDSENDHSFLARCECAATVSSAVPSVLKSASLVARGANGDGLAEIIDELVATDLSRLQGKLKQHLLPIGRRVDGSLLTVPPYGVNLLIAGPSGTGKSTVAAGIVERLANLGYQLCVVDPEGDYGTLPDIISMGHQNHPISVNEVLAMLEDPQITLNANLLGIPLADRPAFFGQLFPSLQAMRTRTGRPHWIILDEAHHMLPAEWAHVGRALPQRLGETVLVTVHPDHVAPAVLSLLDAIIAVGPSPQRTIQKFAEAIGKTFTWPDGIDYEKGKAVIWFVGDEPPFSVEIIPGTAERIRHHRKYAEGNMRYRSFFFRGPDNRHNLRAQNLTIFSQIAEGIDEMTWLFHLRRGDYSHWFRRAVKDRYLADQAEQIERRRDLSPGETRKLIRGLIDARYTLPE
jgi:HAD superfamily hydrolase (TIGR01484 family)